MITAAKAATIAKHGEAQRARIERGVAQVGALWRTSDGDLTAFCVAQFAPQPDATLARFEATLEQVDGNFQEIGRSVRWGTEVEDGPILPVDGLLAAYDAGAHLTEDLFTAKVAFTALLNFPLTTLADRLRDGASYDRRRWAEIRLTGRFDTRIPSNLAQTASATEAASDQYIAGHNLWMHHVLGEDGQRRFPSKKRLISHWNLRDELKANYADKDGLAKQRTIAKVMERIVTQTIPQLAVNNARVDWNPFSNTLVAAAGGTIEPDAPPMTAPLDTAREPDTRFAQVLAHFRAARAIDKYSPFAPTRLERAFDGAEIPETRVRAMLVEILESPMATTAAAEIHKRLGRALEPHDLWYEFGGGEVAEAELDALTRKRYPTASAFAADLPRIFRVLGFTDDRAKHLAAHIAVDPSRGAGHAMEARRRGDKAHLRTRVEPGGMDYKGYNIAVHELGHNVEQTFSLYDVDHTLLAGVPNTAFTEALAFLFQARDLELLGRPAPGAEVDRLRVLDAFWNTREIAGSALVEIDVWHWLYDHPEATAAELREATVRIARETWDRYYAPTLGGKGTALLAIYSHTISTPLYLFNYVLGHLIAFQVEEHLAGKDSATFAKEFERVSRIGAILPDLWMQQATGKPVGTAPLLDATARALRPAKQ
ncbi:MAG: hypothetical protein H0T79_14085 [Deltaproteobacteria bacterium]|nr:hypothetical protein [Deltaproteobacteria bacterium]